MTPLRTADPWLRGDTPATTRPPADRWRVAVGSLLPLAMAGPVIAGELSEGPAVVLLFAAVTLGCLLGGGVAGLAAIALAGFLYHFLVLSPRMSLALPPGALPHLAGFLLGAALLVAVLTSLRNRWQGAEAARLEAEGRAGLLAERVQLIAPLLDGAPVAFALLDGELRYRYVNRALADQHGRTVAEHLGRHPSDVLPPDVAERLTRPVRRVLETGVAQLGVTERVPMPDGDRYLLGSRYPVTDADGAVHGVAVAVVDVSAEARLQEELRRRVAELDATIQSSPFAIALLDPQLRYRQVNAAFRRLVAGDGAGYAGRSALTDVALPGDLGEVCRRVLDRAEGVGELELDLADATGAGHRLTVNCYPVRVDERTVAGVALVLVDTTARHELAELRVEAERLRATAELAFKLEEAQRLAGFGSWEQDLETGTITWSRQLEAILGRTQPADGRSGVGSFTHPDDAPRAAELLRRLVEDGQPFDAELRLVRADGAVIDAINTGEALREESGRVVRLWGTVQDVTAQRAAERAARAAVVAAEHARAELAAERQALLLLQRAMLPERLPEIPGADLAAVYLPVADRMEIGGDWYDAFVLPDGRVALAVGDVAGHDLRAAALMGQARSALRAYATEEPAPAEVLRRMNALLVHLPATDLVTLLYGVYDPATATLTWGNAGHPAPVRRHGGRVTPLGEDSGLLLGVRVGGPAYRERRITLDPGDAVLWYTDGLVDRRAGDPAAAVARLTGLLAAAPSQRAADVLRDVAGPLLGEAAQDDDVCLLALTRPAPRRSR